MKTIEKTNGTALPQDCDGDGLIPMPEEFAGLYQAGYEAGFASGRESGYRQGYEAGFGDGRRQRNDVAAPAAVENAAENAALTKSRLFGLPCTKCRRLMYSDETRCAYCKAPRAARLGDPPSATSCGPEEGSQREPDGGLRPLRISREK
jgi:hypothetical protein